MDEVGYDQRWSDEVLMEMVRDGDEEAFETLYERYERKVYTYFVKMVGDRAAAVDLSAEVFERTLGAAPRYKPTGPFQAWLFRIASNLGKNYLSRKRPKASLDAPIRGADGDESEVPLLETIPDPTSDVESRVMQAELAEAIQKAIAALPEDQRQAITLLVYDDLSYEEIAETTGVSVGAVKSRIHRARETLRVVLKEFLRGETI
jgi:RNA polymerase sigma-70 factor (ECF subfamily)